MIKSAKGRVPSVIQGPVHVDMKGSFYNLIKSRSYSSFSRKTTSSARRAAYSNSRNDQERPPAVQSTSVPLHQPSTDIKALVDAANEEYFMEDKLAHVLDTASGLVSLSITEDGKLKENSQDPKKVVCIDIGSVDRLNCTAHLEDDAYCRFILLLLKIGCCSYRRRNLQETLNLL